jgi:hypothetical protein
MSSYASVGTYKYRQIRPEWCSGHQGLIGWCSAAGTIDSAIISRMADN